MSDTPNQASEYWLADCPACGAIGPDYCPRPRCEDPRYIDASDLKVNAAFNNSPYPDGCMWCRYADHPSGPDCPLHGSNEACEPMIFIRAKGFYPVASVSGSGLVRQASERAALNPGTLRVEDQYGNVLWELL